MANRTDVICLIYITSRTRLFNRTLSSGYVRVVQLPKRVTVSLRSKLVTTRVITGGKSKNVTPPCSPELGAPIYRWV